MAEDQRQTVERSSQAQTQRAVVVASQGRLQWAAEPAAPAFGMTCQWAVVAENLSGSVGVLRFCQILPDQRPAAVVAPTGQAELQALAWVQRLVRVLELAQVLRRSHQAAKVRRAETGRR